MGKHSCCEKEEVIRGTWTAEEDQKLTNFMRTANGKKTWKALPKLAGLRRCGKSCRLRWINYLRGDIIHGPFTDYELRLIINLHARLGNRWSLIAKMLPGRTDNEIKNQWKNHIMKKLIIIDPTTHHQNLHEDQNTPILTATTPGESSNHEGSLNGDGSYNQTLFVPDDLHPTPINLEPFLDDIRKTLFEE